MRIAVLGSGFTARTLAAGSVRSGHDVDTVGGPIGVQPGLLPAPTVVSLSGDDAEARA